MPIIRTRPNRLRSVRHICRLQEPNRDALVLHPRCIDDSGDYVLNHVIETILAKGRDFLVWRGEDPQKAVAAPDQGHEPGQPRASQLVR
jgi:hypothetical protein